MEDVDSADRAHASEVLLGFSAVTDRERAGLEFLHEVAASSTPFDRASRVHLTASALIVDPPTRRVLMRWHGRHRRWMQVGGHGDPGEHAPFLIALREAREESGLDGLRPYPDADPVVVQVAVVDVPESIDEAAHRHGDVRYLMACVNPDGIKPESSETPLRWCSIEEARDLVEEDNLLELLDRAEAILDRTEGPSSRT